MTDYLTMIETLRDEAALGKAGDGYRMISAEALNAVAYALEELSAENKKKDETIKRAYLIINSLIPNMEETE